MGRNRSDTTGSPSRRTRALAAGLAALALLVLMALAAAPATGANEEDDADLATAGGGEWGYDVSYPQCDQPLPPPGGFAIVGVNWGLSYTANPCLGALFDWALGSHDGVGPPVSLYINTGNPGPVRSAHWPTGQTWPLPCDGGYNTLCSFDYGWNAAGDAFDIAAGVIGADVASTVPWWIDVETANSWNGADLATNRAAIPRFPRPPGHPCARSADRHLLRRAGVGDHHRCDQRVVAAERPRRRRSELGRGRAAFRTLGRMQLVLHRRPGDLHPVRRHHRPQLPLLIVGPARQGRQTGGGRH